MREFWHGTRRCSFFRLALPTASDRTPPASAPQEPGRDGHGATSSAPAVVGGDLVPRARGWKTRQQELVQAHMDAPRAELVGQSIAAMILSRAFVQPGGVLRVDELVVNQNGGSSGSHQGSGPNCSSSVGSGSSTATSRSRRGRSAQTWRW
jgi:hypothetical protein